MKIDWGKIGKGAWVVGKAIAGAIVPQAQPIFAMVDNLIPQGENEAKAKEARALLDRVLDQVIGDAPEEWKPLLKDERVQALLVECMYQTLKGAGATNLGRKVVIEGVIKEASNA